MSENVTSLVVPEGDGGGGGGVGGGTDTRVCHGVGLAVLQLSSIHW